MTTYCTKSTTQRTRESMRKHRLQRRADEIAQIILNEQDEAVTDIVVDPIVTTNGRVSSASSASGDEVRFNTGDTIDEDFKGKNNDNGL